MGPGVDTKPYRRVGGELTGVTLASFVPMPSLATVKMLPDMPPIVHSSTSLHMRCGHVRSTRAALGASRRSYRPGPIPPPPEPRLITEDQAIAAIKRIAPATTDRQARDAITAERVTLEAEAREG